MAAGTWKVYAKAKRSIGRGELTLHTGVFKMALHRDSASTMLKNLSTRSAWSNVGEVSAVGGYAAGGRAIPAFTWTVGVSAKQLRFSYTTGGLVFTASGATIQNIKYAVIRNSTGAAAGKVLCFCTLSTAAFNLTSPNTLTISPAATGVFTLV